MSLSYNISGSLGLLVSWPAVANTLGIVAEEREYNYCKVLWFAPEEMAGTVSLISFGALEIVEIPNE
jgi:hypothetical protein